MNGVLPSRWSEPSLRYSWNGTRASSARSLGGGAKCFRKRASLAAQSAAVSGSSMVSTRMARRPQSVTSAALEEAQDLVVEKAVGRHHRARVDVGRAGEVGEPASCLLDEDLHRRHVPGVEVGLGVDLRLALRHDAVAVVVAEAALARCRVHEPLETLPIAGRAQDVQGR